MVKSTSRNAKTTLKKLAGSGLIRKRSKRAIIASQKRGASRGSPRSFATQKTLAQDDKTSISARASVTPVTRRPADPRVIFLVGFMGAGKTTVGRALARRLGWEFEDLDERIQSRQAQTIEQIFRLAGESAFRMLEHEAIGELLSECGSSRRVVALGGGAIAQPQNAAILRDSGFPVVFLDAPVAELWQRCKQQEIQRPLCTDIEQFRDLYHARQPHYKTAGLRVDTSGKDIESIAAEVACSLGLE